MTLYRIERRAYANKLDGAGAAREGARWNSIKVPVIYCAEHESTVVLEVLAHIGEMPSDRVLVTFTLPDDVSMLKPPTAALPPTWRDLPYHPATQQFGDRFIKEGKALLLRVPTALSTTEWNYLMNPAHPEMRKVKHAVSLLNYPFDPRLFKQG